MSLAQYDALNREVAWALLREYNGLETRKAGWGRIVLDPTYDHHARQVLGLNRPARMPLDYPHPLDLDGNERRTVRSLQEGALMVLRDGFGLRLPEPDTRVLTHDCEAQYPDIGDLHLPRPRMALGWSGRSIQRRSNRDVVQSPRDVPSRLGQRRQHHRHAPLLGDRSEHRGRLPGSSDRDGRIARVERDLRGRDERDHGGRATPAHRGAMGVVWSDDGGGEAMKDHTLIRHLEGKDVLSQLDKRAKELYENPRLTIEAAHLLSHIEDDLEGRTQVLSRAVNISNIENLKIALGEKKFAWWNERFQELGPKVEEFARTLLLTETKGERYPQEVLMLLFGTLQEQLLAEVHAAHIMEDEA